MTEEPLQGRDRVAVTCLQQLQALASEIATATDAISANQMQNFRESVEKQETLCSHLSSVTKQVGGLLSPRGQGAAPRLDSQLEQRIRAACVELQTLNQKYAALLKHSGKSIALLSLLFQSQSGQVLSSYPSKQQTWSCEV